MRKSSIIVSLLLAQSITLCAQQLKVSGAPRLRVVPVESSSNSKPVALSPGVKRVLASTERGIGYTDGDSITNKDVYFGESGTYRVGASVDSGILSDYAGCKVVGMRFALSQSIGKTKAYVYKVDGNSASLVLENTVRRTSDGWNEVRFNSSQEIAITGNDELIFGFDYVETDEMTAAKKGALCFYGNTDTPNASLVLQDDGFYTLNGAGDLCVQLIVDISNMPKKNVRLTHLLSGNKYKRPDEKIDAYLQFNNVGLDDISSVRLGYRFDNGAATYVDTNKAVESGRIGTFEQYIDIPSDLGAGKHSLTFFVDNVDGEAAPNSNGKTITSDFVVYSQSLDRQKVYVEQYNDLDAYIPSLTDSGMDEVGSESGKCLVNLFQNEQELFVEGSDYLNKLYAYTTPCFTINRFYFFGENTIAFDVNDYAMMMPGLVADAVRMLVDEAAQNPVFATVNIAPAYNSASRQLSIDVYGDVSPEMPAVYGDMGLTVMLTEDKVKARQRVVVDNKLAWNQDYVHNNVLRRYVTAATGDNMTVVDGKYSAHYTVYIPAGWNADNMKVVAIVGKYLPTVTDDNVLDADITNANSVGFDGATNGVGTVRAADASADGVYSLDGVRLATSADRLPKGIYIVRTAGESHKVVVK